MDIVITQSLEVFGKHFEDLPTVVGAAEDSGNCVHVVDSYDAPGVEEFRKLYVHHSPNGYHFERWCFERWFMLAHWMKEKGLSVVFNMDSDVLVFPGLDEFYEVIPRDGLLATIPVMASYITLDGANWIADYIMAAFKNGHVRALCPGHVSDDALLFAALTQNNQPNVAQCYRPWMIDPNLVLPFGSLLYEQHRDIAFYNGIPYFFDCDQTVRLVTIHCWGHSKNKIGKIWQQAKRSVTEKMPVRLCLDTPKSAEL